MYPGDASANYGQLDRILGNPARRACIASANYQDESAEFCLNDQRETLVGLSRRLRIAQAARKRCAWPERRDGSMVYPTCTYLNADHVRHLIPRKARRQAKLNSEQELALGISHEFGNPTRQIKSRD